MTLAVSKSSLYCWNALLNSACTAGKAEAQAQGLGRRRVALVARRASGGGGSALSMSGWYVAALWNGCTGGAYLQHVKAARTRATSAQEDALLNFAIDQQPIALGKL